ncbi:MAG: sugar transferase, partial [Solirubrobacterales bacterium]|nr:sugar transferase [Solirubrobacterales bacterium]
MLENQESARPNLSFERRATRLAPRGRLARAASGISDGPARAVIARRDRAFRRSLVVADAAAALIAITLAVNVFSHDRLRPVGILAALIAVLVSKVVGLYDRDELVLTKSTLDESPQLFQLAALYALLISLLQHKLVDGDLGAKQIVGVWVLLFFGAFAGRVVARWVAGSRMPPERCLVIGDLRSTGAIGAKLDREKSRRQTLAARLPLDFDDDRSEVLRGVREAIETHDAHRVILAPQAADSEAVLDTIRLVKSLGVKVSLLPRLFEVVGSSVVFDDLDGVTVLGVRRFGLSRSSAAVKRTMDLVFAGLAVVATAPLLVLLALLIRLDSPGGLLFRQIRVGRDGKRFEMLKFRSMVVDADAVKLELRAATEQDGMFKLVDDPRVTRIGRLLRATSLDEL